MRPVSRFDRIRWLTLAVGLPVVLFTFIALAYKPARPPKPEQLVGVWIGFDEDQLNFTRLDLRADATGFCVRVSPADTSLHDYGVEGYRVAKWTMDNWKFNTTLTPATTNAEPVFLRGRYSIGSLRLEIGGSNGRWKRELLLFRESRLDGANQETKQKIKELEGR